MKKVLSKIKCVLGFHSWGLTHYATDDGPVYSPTQPTRRCASCNREERLDISQAKNYHVDIWESLEG